MVSLLAIICPTGFLRRPGRQRQRFNLQSRTKRSRNKTCAESLGERDLLAKAGEGDLE